jgi:ribosomal 50S subunit-recycling heat shock protein
VPENIEEVKVSAAKVTIPDALPNAGEGDAAQNINCDPEDSDRIVVRADKLIREAGMVSSTSEAGRKIKERAVHIDGRVVESLAIVVSVRKALTVRVGRKIKTVRLT